MERNAGIYFTKRAFLHLCFNEGVHSFEIGRYMYLSDRRRPTRIDLKKVGRHLERGTAIPFNGLEVQVRHSHSQCSNLSDSFFQVVDSYKVLFPVLQSLRYIIPQTAQMGPSKLVSTILSLTRPCTKQYQYL